MLHSWMVMGFVQNIQRVYTQNSYPFQELDGTVFSIVYWHEDAKIHIGNCVEIIFIIYLEQCKVNAARW
jgi:hypothetical protein